MIQEIKFPSMRSRDEFVRVVEQKYTKDFYKLGTPVYCPHYLFSGGGPYKEGSMNSFLVQLDLSKVSDVAAVGTLVRFYGGIVQNH